MATTVDPRLRQDVIEILAEGRDMTIATLRPDGFPQATTVSYASDGTDIYFGCGQGSQKAQDLALDGRVSLTVNLPYGDWSRIRGVSLAGRAERVAGEQDLWRVAELFARKFPEVTQYGMDAGEVAFFRVRPQVVSLLDYRKGFGHTDLLTADELSA
ncbi:MAG: pyridoxamine 5'-phosphate oxidase family protein [Pseudomonadota bacterium]